MEATLKGYNYTEQRIKALESQRRNHPNWAILPLVELKTCPQLVQLATGAIGCFGLGGTGCTQIVNV